MCLGGVDRCREFVDFDPSFQTVAPAGQAGERAKSVTFAAQLSRERVGRHPCANRSQSAIRVSETRVRVSETRRVATAARPVVPRRRLEEPFRRPQSCRHLSPHVLSHVLSQPSVANAE